MMPSHPNSEPASAALLEALDRVAEMNDAEREAWLRDLHQREPELASRLRAMIAAADSMDELDQGPGLLACHLTDEQGELDAGTRLGAWRLVELLGRGGMGRVYLGERADGAFEKKVAIKVLRSERRLPDAVIEHERALLARLEHPGLTRLLDGGISEDGDAFLVMELVEGRQLDVWCADHQPDLRSQLDLFEQILDAVAHAHRQLVVHGDLKPANVIVDSERRVRVLDFGVARMLSSASPNAPRAITPGWVAPECEAGAPADVASDIYNLGQLLKYLAEHAAAEGKGLPKDLTAIIRRCMQADPDSRYSSVVSLREDLARFRHSQPVDAREGGRAYRLQRFVQRHWIGVGFATLVFGILLAAGSLIAWKDRVVRSERDTARLAAARSQTVLDYLLGVLGQAGQPAKGKPVSIRTLLNDSLDHIDSDFSGDPAARQALLARLGELLQRLNDFASAEQVLQHFQQNVTDTTPPLLHARALDNLAVVRMHQGKLDEARRLAGKSRELLGTVAADKRGQMSELLVTQAQIQSKQGDLQESIATLKHALSLRLAVSAPDAAQTVVVRNSLAASLMRNGELSEALRQFRQIESALASSHRENSLDAATIFGNHASTAFAYGRYREARRLFDKALKLQQELYGPSAVFAALLNNAGKLELKLGHLDSGRARIQRAVTMMAKYAGADSIDSQLIRLGLGQVALAEGHPRQARAIYHDIGDRLAEKLGKQHPLIARVRSSQLIARAQAENLAANDPAFSESLERLASPGNQRPRAQLLCQRAELALQQDRLALANESASACVDTRSKHLAANSPPLLIAQFLKATAQMRLAADAGTRQSRDAALSELRRQLGKNHPALLRLAAL